jgi:hypothetical protein
MARIPADRQILDDDGAAHNYAIVAHPAVDGLKLAAELFGLAGPTIGKALDILKSAAVKAAKGHSVSGPQPAGEAARGVMEELLGTDIDLKGMIAEISQAIACSDLSGLAQKLLRYTTRDKVALDSPMAINLAYGANYGELAEALAYAIEANGFARFFVRLAARAGSAAGLTLG